MKALTWQGTEDVRVEEVPDPRNEEPTDAIVRITSTGPCGSDLHLYRVLGAFLEPGDVLGHEPMGIVEEVGPEAALFAQCETTQTRETNTGPSLFGYRLPLSEAPQAYETFQKKENGAFKVILEP